MATKYEIRSLGLNDEESKVFATFEDRALASETIKALRAMRPKRSGEEASKLYWIETIDENVENE